MRGLSAFSLAALLLAPATLGAEVTRVEIARRADLGLSGYEKIVGTIHFAVDPKATRNRGVVDTPRGPYFIKLTGPAQTIAKWDAAFNQFVSSLKAQ